MNVAGRARGNGHGDGATAPRPPVAALPEPSLAELVGGIVDDARLLVRKEIELARAEVKQEIATLKRGAVLAVAAGALLWFATMAVLAALALGAVALGAPPWAAVLGLGILLAVVGVVVLKVGTKRLAQFHAVPQRTLENVRKDVPWTRN